MDGLEVIESLDSLWFFSNIFSSSTTQPPLVSDVSDGDGNIAATQTLDHTKQYSPRSEPSKHMTPILENQQTQSTIAEIMPQICSKCGDFGSETDQAERVESVVVEVVESPKPQEKEERRRRRRRKRSKRSINSGFYQRGMILGELDLGQVKNWGNGSDVGFDVNNFSESWIVEENCGYQRIGSQHHVKMPPLNDGMAMKEHLKSWAYAVACTVR